jgi:hypothetical protein
MKNPVSSTLSVCTGAACVAATSDGVPGSVITNIPALATALIVTNGATLKRPPTRRTAGIPVVIVI